MALIGVGKKNNFGHPSKTILERLKQRNIKIYRTDQMGEIRIEVRRNMHKFSIFTNTRIKT